MKEDLEVKLLDILRELLDLTLYEARVYLYLLLRDQAFIRDIARDVRIPRTKIYQIIRSLRDKGFIEVYRDKLLKARIRDPLNTIAYYTESRCRRLKELSDTMKDIVSRIRIERSEGLNANAIASVDILNTYEEFENSLISDLNMMRSQATVVVSRKPIEINWRRLVLELFRAMIKREIRFRYITPPYSKGSSIIKDLIRHFCMSTQETLPHLFKMIIGENLSIDIESVRSMISRIELYETEFDIPLIIIDGSISYNLFTDPINNRFLFAVRYVNDNYTKSLMSYIDLNLSVKNSRNLIADLIKYCE
ncbi:MAG: helix-turn-helix domain-containing protein [Sulfolobales archaeon]